MGQPRLETDDRTRKRRREPGELKHLTYPEEKRGFP